MYGFTYYLYHTRAPCVVRPFNKQYKPSNSETLSHCVCVYVFALCTYVSMHKCTNMEYLYTYAHWSFIQHTVQANHVFVLFQVLRSNRLHTTRPHRKTRTWTPILHQNKSQNLSANYGTFCLFVVTSFFTISVFCTKLESYLFLLQSLCLFYNLSKCILLFLSYIQGGWEVSRHWEMVITSIFPMQR